MVNSTVTRIHGQAVASIKNTLGVLRSNHRP